MEKELEKELKNLQDQFASFDLMTKKDCREGMFELLLKKLLPLEFRMEPDHHGAPHIHINYGREIHAASYRINDGVRVAGTLKNKYDKIVADWISKNETTLKQIWSAMQAGDQKSYEQKIGQLI